MNVLRVLSSWPSGGFGWGVMGVLYTWPTELLTVVHQKRHSWAYSWTWRHNVALICLVGVCCFGTEASRWEKTWMGACLHGIIENHKFLMCFLPSKKIDSLCRWNANFDTWVTRLPIERNVHVSNVFWQVPQIPAFCLLASKISISNLSPLQGRRVNRLPSFPTPDWWQGLCWCEEMNRN